jgi:hypothetical protein
LLTMKLKCKGMSRQAAKEALGKTEGGREDVFLFPFLFERRLKR